jgi:RNA polymerase sigma-70 factor (ECF subfamily)
VQYRSDGLAATAGANTDFDDRVLVIRAQSGDKAAFDQLVNKYRDRIVKLSLRYTRNWADAEDVAQTTFIKAFLGLPQFRGEAAFYSWLHRIAINSAKNLCAQRARELVSMAESPGEVLAQDSRTLANIETPEDIALTDEMSHVVNEAIGQLSREQRTAIILRELEGQSYAAMAVAMSCPIGTVRSRVFRAREAIDEELRRLLESGLSRLRRSAPCLPQSPTPSSNSSAGTPFNVA